MQIVPWLMAGVVSAGACSGCHRETETAQKASPVSAVSAGSAAAAASPTLANGRPRVPTVVPQIVTSMAHDHGWFTQGLAFWEGRLFEGTGMYGESLVHELDPRTGSEMRKVPDDALLFGEGITVFHDELYQLTWHEHECVIYDPDSLHAKRTLAYDGEGWGSRTMASRSSPATDRAP